MQELYIIQRNIDRMYEKYPFKLIFCIPVFSQVKLNFPALKNDSIYHDPGR